MAAAAHDTLFDGPGIRSDTQHFEIMVRFEHQEIDAMEMHAKRIRDIAEVGGDGGFQPWAVMANPTGSAASCGMVKLETSKSPTEKRQPA